MNKVCYQINLQYHFGGGEIYTQFFTKALTELGWKHVLFTLRSARYWRTLEMGGTTIIPVDSAADIPAHLPKEKCLVVCHETLKEDVIARMEQHTLCCFAHMPFYQRRIDPFIPYDLVFCVSQYVLDTAIQKGLTNCYPSPMYGIANFEHRSTPGATITRQPGYDWDRHKVRDKLLGKLFPLYWLLAAKPRFQKRDGITLGIVSRITPIKQFPALFENIAPIIAKHPQINVEIFGCGGYASMRDLKQALRPIRQQVRFWGHQGNVIEVYKQLDFLLAGLPEKEALGLNVIEAQALGTPALAINAPPFTETIVDKKTGFLYKDPRKDNGHDFEKLLNDLTSHPTKTTPEKQMPSQEQFSYPAFVQRCRLAFETTTKMMET